MPLALQLHLVMMRKYSKFGVDTFNTFWEVDYIKDFAWQWSSSDQNKVDFFLETDKNGHLTRLRQLYRSSVAVLDDN